MSEVVRIEQDRAGDIDIDRGIIDPNAVKLTQYDAFMSTVIIERSSIPKVIAALKKIGGGE